MYPSDSFSPPVVCVCVEEGGGRGRRRGRGRGERLGEGIEQESYLLVLATMFLTLPSQLAGEQEKHLASSTLDTCKILHPFPVSSPHRPCNTR